MDPNAVKLRGFTLALVLGIASSAILPDNLAVVATPKGNGAWLYVETQQQIDLWKQQITNYNTLAGPQRAIRVLYVYSMDFDITYQSPVIGKLTEIAAKSFRSIPYVTHVGAIIDGILSGSANLNSLTSAKVKAFADSYARVYCNSSALDGIQLDLEPYSATYKNSTLTFVRRLSQNLRDNSTCAKPKFLAFFVGPRQADADLYDALGPNGYAVISGYDLDSPKAGYPETPKTYQTNLLTNVKVVLTSAATSKYGKFSIGLPFAASACEFQTGISTTNPAKTIPGYPMYDANNLTNSYIPNAFAVLNQTLGAGYEKVGNPFLGVSVWAWVSRDVVVSGYRHVPKLPFDTSGMMSYMAKTMPCKNTV
ncbi:hypothetical protein Agub_g734 [Astrephomene gubernaculifera]|uniref:GH18 domain-containing protein n=1 Tax=Astrephomene gubernaculifera TaxID=47775 RepID=A0AAD3HGP3_9CHLO|nr:hypothetical protein Agub_g734 [Astrephomene gubernaculifera]